MATTRKKMNAVEIEKWLLREGAVPINDETEKEPWYREVSKPPQCLKGKKRTQTQKPTSSSADSN